MVELFPRQTGKKDGWTLEYRFLVAVQDYCPDDADYGTPSLETIETVLLAAERELEARNREGKPR